MSDSAEPDATDVLTDEADTLTAVYHLENDEGRAYVTWVVGAASLPLCRIFQGVPNVFRDRDRDDSEFSKDETVYVCEESARKIIAGLQQWLQDRQTYRDRSA